MELEAYPREKIRVSDSFHYLLALLLPGLPAVWGATPAAPEYRTDQILIQPKADVSRAALAAFHAAHGAGVRREFTAACGAQVITLPAGETVAGLIAKYQKSGLVEFAEPDYLVYADATLPNDPKFTDGTLWGLYNYGQNGRHRARGH